MNQNLKLHIYRDRELCHTTTLKSEVQIGRQRPGEPGPFHYNDSGSRLIIAPVDEKLVSREHLALIPARQSGSEQPPEVEIRNLSRKRSVVIEGIGRLGPEEVTCATIPLLLSFENFAIRVETSTPSSAEVRSLEHPTLAPGCDRPDDLHVTSMQQSILKLSTDDQYSSEKLIHWLGQTMEVLQSAAGATDFLAQAVEALDHIVGFDSITALRHIDGLWTIEESKRDSPDASAASTHIPSQTILDSILERKSTVYHLPASSEVAASLQGVTALVASPILNTSGDVIGALYGARFGSEAVVLPNISELEATMVEVIACGAAAGISRELQQQKALAARVQFEQFFTPELARELENNPRMLEGHDADISVLFCDIVGFSSISARIGSALTMDWISDVMEHLSVVVLEHEGVVVDYLGDELMAMWGAPKDESEHATKACHAAIDLMRCKQRIDAVWQSKVGQGIDFRIGIASGIASVGNTGSKRRLKYGPLGNTVNLASRLQNAAKQLGVRQLISQSTASATHETDGIVCRPLGTVGLVNIPNPIPVFELISTGQAESQTIASGFSRIINELGNSTSEQAHELLTKFLEQQPADKPGQLLAERLASGQEIDPTCIWQLETK